MYLARNHDDCFTQTLSQYEERKYLARTSCSFIPVRFTVTRVNRRVTGRCFNSIVNAESTLYAINELKIGYYLSASADARGRKRTNRLRGGGCD